MARKFTAGAEFGGVLTDSDYDSLSGTTISWDTGTVRSGGFAWKFLSAASSPFLTRQYTSAANDSYVRGYINVAAMTTASSISIFLIRDATNGNNVNIRLTRTSATTFTLALFNEQTGLQVGSSSGSLNINTWYRVEFSYINATGAMAAYIDGVQFATGTGTASLGSNTLRWGSIDASTMTIFFDDLAVNDQTTGGTQTGLPGDGAVIRAKPNAQGDTNTFGTQTGGIAGAANAFTRLNESPPDDATTFDGSSTLNQEDLVKVDVSGVPSTATVNVVEVWARFRNSTADTAAAIKFEIEKTAAGTISQSAAIVPNSTTWKMNALAVPKAPPLVLYQDPGSVNWNPATWAPQVGYKLTTGPGTANRRVDVTSISAIIDFLTTTTSTSTTTTSTSTTTTTSSSTSSSTTTTSTSSSTSSSTTTTSTSSSSSTSSSTTTTSTSSSTTSSTSSSTTTTSTSSSTSITTSTTTTLALLETLIDPWNTIDLTKWDNFVEGGGTIVSGQLQLAPGIANIVGESSHNDYTLISSHGFQQVVAADTQNTTWQVSPISIWDSPTGELELSWFIVNNTIHARRDTSSGGGSLSETTATYDPAVHKWFRIREAAGIVYWDYATDGITWTNLRSEANPYDVSFVFVTIYGDNIAGATTKTATLDNFNVQATTTSTSTSTSTTTTSTSSSTTTSTSSSTTTTSTSSSTSITTSTSTTHTTTSTSSTTSTSLTTSTSSSTTTTSTSSSSSSSTTLTQTTTSTSTSITTSTTQTIELGFNIGQPPSYAMEDSFINSIPTDE